MCDLAELIDRRWHARLFETGGNVRVAAVGDFPKGVGNRLPRYTCLFRPITCLVLAETHRPRAPR